MVLADFLTATRRRWLKAFKLLKRSRRRVSPAPARSSACACRASLPPIHIASESYENASYYSSCNSYGSHENSLRSYTGSTDGCKSDSAYESTRSSPARGRPVCYATVTYFNVNDSEDSCSIHTEYTMLDYEPDAEEDETAQNMINESIELVSTL